MTGFRIQWALEEHLTARARAVQHALVIMQAVGVTTWDELAPLLARDPEAAERARDGASLDLDELTNPDAHEQTLRGLRRSARKRAGADSTTAECAARTRWG